MATYANLVENQLRFDRDITMNMEHGVVYYMSVDVML